MNKVTVLDKTFRPMIPHDELMSIIDGVADQLNAAYAGHAEAPLLLCTLTGSLPFTAELMKRLKFDPMIASIKVSSYVGTQTTGKLSNILGPTLPVEGKEVIIIEDIVDTGITVRGLRQILADKGAKDVKVCTMLFKPEKFKDEEARSGAMTTPEFVGKEIPNAFILGFGLDYNEYGRCLNEIYVLDE